MKDSFRLWYSDLVSGQEVNAFFFFTMKDGSMIYLFFTCHVILHSLTCRNFINIQNIYLDGLSSSTEYQIYFETCIAFG